MRWLGLSLVALVGVVAFACGGAGGLGADYASNFVGTWSGDMVSEVRGATPASNTTPGMSMTVVAKGSNALEIQGVCTEVSGPGATVTGPASFQVSGADCGTGTLGNCTSVRFTVRSGSGVLAGDTLTVTMAARVEGCGSAIDFDLTYAGHRAGGAPDAGTPDAGTPDAGAPDGGTLPGEVLPALAHGVLGAAYSRALDRLVMTDGTTQALYVYDPATATEQKVALPLAPQCLSLSPDGSHALVGHDAWISYVDLAGPSVEKKIPVSADVGDCVLGGNGYAYLFPRVDQWVSLHDVVLATGVESESGMLYAGTHARLLADGSAMYTVTSGLSPANMERWSVAGGVAAYAWASPYWGDYAMGPQLWMSADGARVFTSAGTAFRSSSASDQDLVYGGRLSGLSGVASLDSSPTEVAAIPSASAWDSTSQTDGTVELFNNEFLGHTDRITLPRWQVGSTSYPVHGRFVFYGAGYTTKYVIVQADGASGLLHDTAVLTY